MNAALKTGDLNVTTATGVLSLNISRAHDLTCGLVVAAFGPTCVGTSKLAIGADERNFGAATKCVSDIVATDGLSNVGCDDRRGSERGDGIDRCTEVIVLG
jgi:hypothetical protein